jgi:secondary thiamine-phosphate synthase enzyme
MPTIEIRSTHRSEMIEVTERIQNIVTASGITEGIVHLFTPHTTAALTINENADPDVVYDMLKILNRLVPHQADYRHSEGNSAAHVKSSLFGCSESIPLENGLLALGTWQGIYFCEFDGPRKRKLQIRIMPV